MLCIEVLKVCKLFYTTTIITWCFQAGWLSEMNKDYSIKGSPISVS